MVKCSDDVTYLVTFYCGEKRERFVREAADVEQLIQVIRHLPDEAADVEIFKSYYIIVE